jgi:hypothetical protein
VTVARKRGDAGAADEYFRRIVKRRGQCEYVHPETGLQCLAQGVDTAHILGRSRLGVRWEEDNAWCMCRTHHKLVDERPHEKMWMVGRTIGLDRYLELWDQAEAFTSGRRTTKTLFVAETVDRLKARCVELGLDPRRRIPA